MNIDGTEISLAKPSLLVEQKDKVIQKISSGIENGTIDPVEFFVYAKTMTKILDAIIKKVDGIIIGEATKYTKTFKIFGIEVTLCSRKKYDYRVCGDSVWDRLQAEKIKIDEKIKKREKFLAALDREAVNPETGEIISAPSVSISEYLSTKI